LLQQNKHLVLGQRYKQTKIPSWVVRKVLESRDQLINRLGSHGTIQQQLVKAQLRDRFSIRKMYVNLMPVHSKVAWKHLALHTKIHPRYKFILWLAIQKRLATVERLQKFGITVLPDCVFCCQHLETFSHLFFECSVTKKIWNCMLQWFGHRRQIQDWETEVNWMSQIARRRGGVAEITSCVFAMVVKVMLMPMPKMGGYLVSNKYRGNSIRYLIIYRNTTRHRARGSDL